jgi:hypothetical protein
MSVTSTIEPSTDTRSEFTLELPRWGAWKGLLVGAVVEIPVISGAVLLLSWMSSELVTSAALQPMSVIRVTGVFAGIPALATAAGLGRLAAHEYVKRRRRGAIVSTALAHALAGVLLTLIACLPHGIVPTSVPEWLALAGLGVLAGASCGVAIGVVCTGATDRQVTDMISLVKRPGTTLRQLIDSEDLGRIGAVVRQRAGMMFDGLLHPAAPRPDESAPPAASPAASPAAPLAEMAHPVADAAEAGPTLPIAADSQAAGPEASSKERSDSEPPLLSSSNG